MANSPVFSLRLSEEEIARIERLRLAMEVRAQAQQLGQHVHVTQKALFMTALDLLESALQQGKD